jgi:ornithine cyclodeaminase
MNASAITAIRTAAVSAVATQLLAREDAGDMALIGTSRPWPPFAL